MTPRLSVFRSREKIVELRDYLYGDLAAQKRGLALLKAYETRGPLPPAVHVTGLVLAAIHSDVAENDLYAIRQCYSMSIIRMVNELLDSMQTGRAAAPLHNLAKEMQLPNSFVELRHAATHEHIPSISLLRSMANRGLEWLWEHYWALQVSVTQVPKVRVKNGELKQLFRDYRKARKDPDTLEVITQQLVEAQSQYPEQLISVLLHQDVLIPSGPSSVERKVEVASELWLPLFNLFEMCFIEQLITQLVDLCNTHSGFSEESAPMEMGYQRWVSKLISLLSTPNESILKYLYQRPRRWAVEWLLVYYETTFDAKARSMAEQMALGTGVALRPIKEKKQAVWRQVRNWTPRAIGVE